MPTSCGFLDGTCKQSVCFFRRVLRRHASGVMLGSSGAFTVAAAWRPRSLSSKNLSKSHLSLDINGHRSSGFSHEKWWFSIAMYCYVSLPEGRFVDTILDQFPPFPPFQHRWFQDALSAARSTCLGFQQAEEFLGVSCRRYWATDGKRLEVEHEKSRTQRIKTTGLN